MTLNTNSREEDPRDENESTFDFWSNAGAQRYNEILDEGTAYLATNGRIAGDPEMDLTGEEDEYRDPELYDPNEETLPPGEMELIFENCYVM